MIGASGAIAGVLGAYLFYFPRAKILVLVPFFIFFTIKSTSVNFINILVCFSIFKFIKC